MQEHPREGNTEADEDAADAAEAEEAMNEPGDSIPWEQVKGEIGL